MQTCPALELLDRALELEAQGLGRAAALGGIAVLGRLLERAAGFGDGDRAQLAGTAAQRMGGAPDALEIGALGGGADLVEPLATALDECGRPAPEDRRQRRVGIGRELGVITDAANSVASRSRSSR